MAHVSFNQNTSNPRGTEYYRRVKQLRECLDYFQNVQATQVQMLAGNNGSSIEHFADHVSEFGIMGTDATAQKTAAQLRFNELNSWLAAGSNQSALEQFLAIHG